MNCASHRRKGSLPSLAPAHSLSRRQVSSCLTPMAGMEPSRFPVNASMPPSSYKAQNDVTPLVKRADVLEQAKGTCRITRQLCFSHRGLPWICLHFPSRNTCPCTVWLSTHTELQGTELRVHVAKAATMQLIAEVAGWRAACCAIQLSTCCRSIHSAAPTVP